MLYKLESRTGIFLLLLVVLEERVDFLAFSGIFPVKMYSSAGVQRAFLLTSESLKNPL